MKTTETPMNLFWLDAGAQLLAARSPHPGSASRNERLQLTVAGSTLLPGTRVLRAVGCVRLHAYTFPAEQVWLCGYAAACLTGTKLNEDFSGGGRRPLCITRVWKRKRFYRWLASEGTRPGTDPVPRLCHQMSVMSSESRAAEASQKPVPQRFGTRDSERELWVKVGVTAEVWMAICYKDSLASKKNPLVALQCPFN